MSTDPQRAPVQTKPRGFLKRTLSHPSALAVMLATAAGVGLVAVMSDKDLTPTSKETPERQAFKLVSDSGTPAPSAEPGKPDAAPDLLATSGGAAAPATEPTATESVPSAVEQAATPTPPAPSASVPHVDKLNDEVEKLKTVVNVLLADQNHYSTKADLQTEVSRLEGEVAALKTQLQKLQSTNSEPTPVQPLAKVDDEQQQWRAYSGGGTVTMTNLMPDTLIVRIAGIEFVVKSGHKATALGLKPGQVTTEIVGHEGPRVWELKPPYFRQDLVIK